MLQIYTGKGKGKTTAAIGLALRALGAGKKVLFVQFLKAGKSSELKALQKFRNFHTQSFGRNVLLTRKNVSEKDEKLAVQGLWFAAREMHSGKYDLVVLDEINVAVQFRLLSLEELLELIKRRPKKVELVLTGRYAPKKLLQKADLATEMKEVKHYFRKGQQARKGIEF